MFIFFVTKYYVSFKKSITLVTKTKQKIPKKKLYELPSYIFVMLLCTSKIESTKAKNASSTPCPVRALVSE